MIYREKNVRGRGGKGWEGIIFGNRWGDGEGRYYNNL